MKKNVLRITLALSISLMILPTVPAYAGDINAVEQDVINFCSGVFYYEGKAYKATPSAISSAYAKMAADDVDLTPEKGEAAKRLAMNNIKRGIDEGYLVEIDMPQESTSEVDTESGTGQTSGTGSGEAVEGNTTTGNNETESMERVTTQGNNSVDATTGDSTEEISNEETTTEPDMSEKDTSKNNVSTESENSTTNPFRETEEQGSELEKETTVEVVSDDEVENKVTGNGEVLNIDSILESTNEEIIVEKNTEQETLYNVQDYVNGEELIVKEEGEIIYQNDLPVKNTGYSLAKGKIVLTAIILLFFGNVLAALIVNRKQEKR